MARLEMSMPQDMEAQLSSVHKAVEAVKTSLEATNRFTKEFVTYMKDLPRVQEEIEKLHQSHNEGLQATAANISNITEPTKSVSTPISGLAAPTSGLPSIPDSEVPKSPQAAHEYYAPTAATPGTAPSPAPAPNPAVHPVVGNSPVSTPDATAAAGSTGSGQTIIHTQIINNDGGGGDGSDRNAGSGSAQGARVVGHIPVSQGAEASAPPPVALPHVIPATTPAGRRLAPQLKSQLDYREKLAAEIGDDPAKLYDRLHQRGLTNETMEHGSPKFEVQLGKKTVSADEFIQNPQLHEDALDTLAKEAAPQGSENGGGLARATHAAQLAGGIGRTLRRGGDASGTTSQLGEYVSSLGKAGGAMEGMGGAISKAAPGIGVAGGAVGAVLGANAIVQSGGARVQGLAAQGMEAHGGGVGEGLKIEKDVAAMALNPFITNEQSRQLIMGALKTGATGKEYDNVVGFMKSNLVDMNMGVAESTGLLKKNVKEGGQSIESLGLQLQSLKSSSETGSTTFADSKAQFQKTTQESVDEGVGGQQAGRQALVQGEINNERLPNGETNALREPTRASMDQANSSQAMAGIIGARYHPGLNPRAVRQRETEDGTWNKHVIEFQAEDARNARAAGPENQSSVYRQYQQSRGVTLTQGQSDQMVEDYNRAQDAGRTPTQIGEDKDRAATDRVRQSAGNTTTRNDRGPADVLAAFGSHLMDGITPGGDEGALANQAAREGAFSNPALDKVTQQFGMENTIVYDEQGNPHHADYNDQAQMEGLQSGAWTIAGADNEEEKKKLGEDFEGEARSLQHNAQSLTDLASTGITSEGEGEGGGGGTFDLTPQAAQLLQLLPGGTPNDPNALNANQGQAGATHNNPDPGNAGTPAHTPGGR